MQGGDAHEVSLIMDTFAGSSLSRIACATSLGFFGAPGLPFIEPNIAIALLPASYHTS